MLLASQVFAFQALNFQAVRTIETRGFQRLNDLRKIDPAFAERTKTPLAFSPKGVLQVYMHDAVRNFPNVLRRIDVVIVVIDVAGVVVQAHMGMIQLRQKLPRSFSILRRTLVCLQGNSYAP